MFCRTYKAEFQPRYKVVPTPGLVAAVQALPTTYNYTDYVKFLEDWGTHYVYSVEMGGGYVCRHKHTVNICTPSREMSKMALLTGCLRKTQRVRGG